MEITLKYKYRAFKPKGKNRANYAGHSAPHRTKHGRGLRMPYRIDRGKTR